MKKLIATIILSAFAFTSHAEAFHANINCQGTPAELHLSNANNVTILADGVLYPFGMDSVTIPNMGGTDMVVMVRAKSQSGKEAAFSYTRQSLNEGKVWLLVDGQKEKECRVINSWTTEHETSMSGSRITVTHAGE